MSQKDREYKVSNRAKKELFLDFCFVQFSENSYDLNLILSHNKTFSQFSKNNYDFYLSHNNPYFPCNVAITNFLVSHTYNIRFHDVALYRTVRMFT